MQAINENKIKRGASAFRPEKFIDLMSKIKAYKSLKLVYLIKLIITTTIMKKVFFPFLIIFMTGILGCQEATVEKIKIGLNAKSGSNTSGEVKLTEKDGVVTMEAHIFGLEPGTHAIHLHEKADCSSSDGKSTGGHWNPTFEQHGAWENESGFHRGDIGNFEADDKGHGMVKFSTDLWCIGCEDPVKNIVGKAVIVHQGADDLVSQPSGAAGLRVSCAGIIQ